ncbi:hypothetical protein GF319_00830 [Candidatus Bathyarchaeota archaeon]|nr:hypothetical protein [Candidatus Bathyarchaeota archaeon]
MNLKTRKILPALLITALLSQLINTGLVFAQQPTGQLSTLGGTAEIVQHPTMGTLVHLEAAGKAAETANASRIEIRFTETTTLNDLKNLSWTVNTTQGYPPHADILLSLDGETRSDQLVCEYAYQPYTGLENTSTLAQETHTATTTPLYRTATTTHPTTSGWKPSRTTQRKPIQA